MAGTRCWSVLALVSLLSAGHLFADGLAPDYGGKLPSVYDEGDKLPKLKGKEFKVLDVGVLEAGTSKTLKKVVYRKKGLCMAVGYGRGQNTDLNIVVTGADDGNEIGKDDLKDNFPLVVWRSGGTNNAVDVRVHNAGSKACVYVLLANY